jgi:hypothetical protein
MQLPSQGAEPVQRKPSGDASSETPASLPRGGGQALPGDVQAKMGAAFGADFASVRVHEGPHVTDMGAAAYTQGADIHFAPGQYQPGSQGGQELIGHELAHVVQQSQGQVGATTQAKGVGINDDESLEREADEMGARAARGESASASSPAQAISASNAVQRKVIQKKDVKTHYGTFKTTKFDKVPGGVDCVLMFDPDPDKIDAKKIGLTQTAKITRLDGSHTGIDPTKEGRRVTGGAGADYVLDRVSTRNNPIYGADNLGAGDGLDRTKQDNNTSGDPTKVGDNATYQLGHAYTDGGVKKKQEAGLWDKPVSGSGGNLFETAALGLEGTDQGKYFGSVKWGTVRTSTTNVDVKDIELASMGMPTQDLLAAAALWNTTKTRGTLVVTADPAKAKKTSDGSAVDVAKGTKLKQLSELSMGGKPMVQVQTLDGSNEYYVNVVDLKDDGSGGNTVDLPVPIVYINAAGTPLYSDAERKTKVKDLPSGTRMQNTGGAAHGSYGIKIVDGADIGKTGYVEQTKVQQEK